MDHRDSDLEGSVQSNNDAELSEAEEDSHDAVPNGPQQSLLPIVKQENREDVKMMASSGGASSVLAPSPGFSIPINFPFNPQAPFPHSGTAGYQPSSASSHSSESSSSSQQTWSFEEQFKQVRQLYELSDDPKRKEFLDDLFFFMQRRGTPINRLPIMAKSVLDLFELYNLVIQRGGLVDVINKKLWQEIIKGLHLPSSITSAAFTLRTQYMKYLYPYECEKRRLSTPGELQAAIDGNRREGRRGSYGTYTEMMQRSPAAHLNSSTSSPGMSLVHRGPVSMNGSSPSSHLNNNNHISHQGLLPPSISGTATIGPNSFEARMVEYVKMINKELGSTPAPPVHRPSSPGSPPEGSTNSINPLEMSRLTLWNLYQSTAPHEPQKEALNLEKRDDPLPPPPPPKRHYPDNQDDINVSGAHIKISNRGDSINPVDHFQSLANVAGPSSKKIADSPRKVVLPFAEDGEQPEPVRFRRTSTRED